jgi:hypothetical protein
MTTTPLPPPDTHCFDDDTNMDVWSYSAPLVEQIVKQAHADLEAEVKRLREALRIAHDHIDMNALRVSHCTDAEAINAARAALENTK